jgi:hypothetical protein
LRRYSNCSSTGRKAIRRDYKGVAQGAKLDYRLSFHEWGFAR